MLEPVREMRLGQLITYAVACWVMASAAALAAQAGPAAGARANLALGKKVIFSPEPNNEATSVGGTDAFDLTDGKLAERAGPELRLDPAAVGYSYAGLVQWSVDLQAVGDIGEVAVRFEGGAPEPSVCFPPWVELLVSNDGLQYYRVASFDFWRPGDRDKYGIPRDQGKAWVHTLRFREINVRARYVGLSFYSTGYSSSDEMWVYQGDPGTRYRKPEEGTATDFSAVRPRAYFHKPIVLVATNMSTPTPVGLAMPAWLPKAGVTWTLDVPRGIRCTGFATGWGVVKPTPQPAPDRSFTRYAFTWPTATNNREALRLFLQADGPAGRGTVLRHELQWEGGKTLSAEQPLEVIEVPSAPRPKRLLTGLAWWGLSETEAWPDALRAFETLGFNTFPVFARQVRPRTHDEQVVEAFRQAKFKVLNVDSTFHGLVDGPLAVRKEVTCQFSDFSHGDSFCPSYRGPLYASEIERLAQDCVRVKAAYLSCDIELWCSHGLSDSRRCLRCLDDFRKSGMKDWKEWQLAKGEEIWRDLAAKVRTASRAAGLAEPELGLFGTGPGRASEDFWPFDRLYPEYLGHAESGAYSPLYPYHLRLVGDMTRADRLKLPRSDVFFWLTPGDAGPFPGEVFTWAIVECFANGARGTPFWSDRLWDAENLAAYARAIRIVAPVEDIIVDGTPVSDVRTRPPLRVSGMRRGDDFFLLVADYDPHESKTLEVELPLSKACVVTDLGSGKIVGEVKEGQRVFRVSLKESEPATALYVKAR